MAKRLVIQVEDFACTRGRIRIVPIKYNNCTCKMVIGDDHRDFPLLGCDHIACSLSYTLFLYIYVTCLNW